MRSTRHVVSVVSIAVATLVVACEAQLTCELCEGDHLTEDHVERAAQESGTTPESDEMFSDDVLLAFVARHRSDGFIRVNERTYSSDVSDKELNVFVSEFALPEYLETQPAQAESEGMIPRGSFVVRELVDGAGDVTKLTALYRGPKGYNPTSGDFWFAVTDPEGNVLPDEQGTPMAGPLTGCSSCHASRASSDFLFGVPRDVRYSEFAHPDVEPEVEQPPTEEEEVDSPNSPTEEEPPDKPRGEASYVDLTGWSLRNVQSDLSRPQSAEFGALAIRPGTNVVIARDATKAEFEAYWGPLPEGVTYVNRRQSGGFEAPIVNGDETWELRDATGAVVDGPTPVGRARADYRRQSAEPGDWLEFATTDATPGTVYAELPEGVWLTEWADADEYRMEFVEIAVRGDESG